MPSPPARGVQLILSFPGKLDPPLSGGIFQPAVHVPLDQTELEMPGAVLPKAPLGRLECSHIIRLQAFDGLTIA
jgi:hypothetical protein